MRNLTLATLFLGFLFSCSNHVEIPVWKITKEGAPESYLVGTIDYLNKTEDGDLLNKLITDKFNNSNTFINQIDAKNSDFLLTKQELEIGMNQTLKEVMNETDFEYLQKLVFEFNRTENHNYLTPDSNKTKLIFYLQDLLYNNNQDNFFFEQYFMNQAMATKKNILGLETYQDFYRTQSQISESEQLEFMENIDTVKTFSSNYKKQISLAYKKGNYDTIHQITLSTFPYLIKNYNKFYSKKHKFWVSSIDSALSKEKCFISLNIDHLYGNENFLETLLSKGYKVDKIQ